MLVTVNTIRSTGYIPYFLVVSLAFFPFLGHAQQLPRSYVAHRTTENIIIDGKADEADWEKTDWTDLFIDIEGETTPKYPTRLKMLWNDDFIYFFAQLEEPHVWGTLKQRDTVIFYNNDFEIFIDPDGDTHNYYEIEINALNTVWDLFLSKPYRNNGTVLNDWDVKGLQTAVHINGSLNDPTDVDTGWQIEIALPWSFHTAPGEKANGPQNRFWRMNFSRVNWHFDLENGRYSRAKNKETGGFLPEYNWVWSPQGVINMHEPEHWGYVYFSDGPVEKKDTFSIPEEEHLKWYLYALYRKLLKSDTPEKVSLQPKTILGHPIRPKLEKDRFSWHLWAKSPFTQHMITISKDGKYETRTEK